MAPALKCKADADIHSPKDPKGAKHLIITRYVEFEIVGVAVAIEG